MFKYLLAACVAALSLIDPQMVNDRLTGTTPPATGITCAQLGVTCILETSFTTAQGWTAETTQTACAGTGFNSIQTGIGNWGGWTTAAGSCDQVVTAANNSNGAGGRGFRHWRGDAHQNDDGGAISLDWGNTFGLTTGRQTEFWVRVVMRYQSGFAWAGGTPQYTKEFYWTVGATGQGEFGIQGNGWGLHSYYNDGNVWNADSTYGWTNTMGGATGDGLWHCYEWHVKQNTQGPTSPNGVAEIWVDNVQRVSRTDFNFDLTAASTADWDWMVMGENQHNVSNGGVDKYTDYDDLAISLTSRIGGCSGYPKS